MLLSCQLLNKKLNGLQGLIQGIYDLAIHPEYVKELREEAEAMIAEHGWSRAALQKMHKVDSFLKESFRLNNAASCKPISLIILFTSSIASLVLMLRKTLKNWKLSDGTLIPPDVYVGVATEAMNKEEVCSFFFLYERT